MTNKWYGGGPKGQVVMIDGIRKRRTKSSRPKGPKVGPKAQKLKFFLCYLLQYKALTGSLSLNLTLVGGIRYAAYIAIQALTELLNSFGQTAIFIKGKKH